MLKKHGDENSASRKRRIKDKISGILLFVGNLSLAAFCVWIVVILADAWRDRDVCEEDWDISVSAPYEIVVDAVDSIYNPDIGYLQLMIKAATEYDDDALTIANTARNTKIWAEGLDYKTLTVDEFLSDFESYAGFDRGADYITIMKDCCLSGDIEAGRDAASRRNLKLAVVSPSQDWGNPIVFDDLLELAKIITAECGASWLSDEWKVMVGEVVLNRVESPEFPNTIYEVVHQKGQYARANSVWYEELVPLEDCVWAALELLQGRRILNEPSVVFQSGGKQGSGVHTALYDKVFGYTYLCYSSYPELYKED